MIIVVNVCIGYQKNSPSQLLYWQEIFSNGVALMPSYRFIFLFDGPGHPFKLEAANVQWQAVSSKENKKISLFWWLQQGLPHLAKQNQAKLVIHLGTMASLRLRIPQAMLLPDSFMASFPKQYQSILMKQGMPYFFRRISTLILPGELPALPVLKWAPKLQVTKTGLGVASFYQPLEMHEKEAVKEKFAGGKEYFLIHTDYLEHAEAILLLKAFSIFKKRQQAGLLLIMQGHADKQTKLGESLANYKFRSDVKLLGALLPEEQARLTAAAYAVLALDLSLGLETILGAIYCQTAVIAHESLVKSGNFVGVLGANTRQTELLAEQLKLLYKDENHRNLMIQSSQLAKDQFNWPRAAEKFCKTIDEIVSH